MRRRTQEWENLRRRGGIAFFLAVLALSLAAWGSPPRAAAGPPREFFGIVQGPPLDAQDLRTMARSGAKTVRFGLNWGTVQPRPGPLSWNSTDALVGGFAAHGIRPIPVLAGTPSWVAPRGTDPPVGSSHDRRGWKSFLKAAVERYGPGGDYWTGPYRSQHPGKDPVAITSWQVWNEPNLSHYFTPRPSVKKYAQLVRISHEAIASKDGHARVVLAGLTGYAREGVDAWKFLAKLYGQRGIKRHFDAAALHPYSRNPRQLEVEIKKVRSAMRRHHDGHTPLWITELGWGSGHPNRFGLNKGLQGQKRILKRSFNLVLHKRRTWHIQRLFWFDWRDPPQGQPQPCSFCSSAGLLNHDRHPKPAHQAFQRFTRAG
jgi:hypothetical protein